MRSLSASLIDFKKTISHLFTELPSPTVFLTIAGLTTNIWFLNKGKEVIFRKGRLESDKTEKDPVRALLQSCLNKTGIEVRVTFGELPRDYPCTKKYKTFCDGIIGPVVDMLRPQDDALVIVPDGTCDLLRGLQLLN